MTTNQMQQAFLKKLPGVDKLLSAARSDETLCRSPKGVLTVAIRSVLESIRTVILNNPDGFDDTMLEQPKLLADIKTYVRQKMSFRLKRTVNATGVVVHTNLGRSLLSDSALDRIVQTAKHYSNLEFDLDKGQRGSRYSHVEEILCEISGAEAGMVVNNNAGAVLICLETLAGQKEVVVSRGELVEIGGSFRIPDVMQKSGAVLKEVGTTNRTHLRDYAGAISERTAMLLKVHTSNYAVVGFTKAVDLAELVDLGQAYRIIVMEDLGSGTFIDFSHYGLNKEPTVQESIKAGVDLVTFSGDKLLGGPQAGIILGKKLLIDQIRANPLNRALRIDKMTLAALEGTLRLYRDERKVLKAVPTLRMLTLPLQEIEEKTDKLCQMLSVLDSSKLAVTQLKRSSRAGGGALPLLSLPTLCIGLKMAEKSANTLEIKMRQNSPPIIGRIEEDIYLLDMRTVQDDELEIIVNAIKDLLKEEPNDDFP